MINYNIFTDEMFEADEVDGIEIDDIFYVILADIEGFYYLINPDDFNNFLIMEEDGEELVSVNDEDDFNKALYLFKVEYCKQYGLTEGEFDKKIIEARKEGSI